MLQRLLKGAYYLAAALFLVGYASAYLPPAWFWWTSLVAVTVPYTSLLLLVASPLVFWESQGLGRLVHVVLLLLIVLRFVPATLWAPRSVASPDDLVVMTFNAPVRGPNPEALAAATVQLVRTQQPDILTLQEPVVWVDGQPPIRRATAHLQAVLDSLAYWATFPSFEDPEAKVEQPVLARFAFEDIQQIVLPATEGAEDPTHLTRIRFRWQNRPAVLYNLHLQTVGERKPWQDSNSRPFDPSYWGPYLRRYRDAYMRRVWEVRQIRKMLEQETLPVIVAGDFNSTMHHWEYRFLARGLRDAFTARGRGWGATYHARLPLVRIDHILVSPEWEVISAHVPDAHAFSDHRPVVTHLRWRERDS